MQEQIGIYGIKKETLITLSAQPTYTDANTNIDLLSNGFKWRTSDDNNNDVSETYLYIAFAESPFKHTNAR